MVSPILATKLYIPHVSPNFVPRTRLIDRLNGGLYRKLTLISAPAGFGKTTLISEWLEALDRNRGAVPGEGRISPVWISLDGNDSDPVRFMTYLVYALQATIPEMSQEVLAALQSPQSFPIESILPALLNEVAAIQGKILLVLDDYHLIDSQPIDDAITFLLDHQPPNLHLVITTREDPQLPLAKLRARGQLTEMRASDLRFTPADAADFLKGMGVNLSAEDVATLDDRTEGWIAGLQLAALALQTLPVQHGPDASGFIQAFAGDHRYVMDYLVEEVLQRLPDPTRNFLLQTSILDRLHGPLCAAVTGKADGGAQLEALLRGNFFIVPLDDRRQWYRYHHLFADVLQAHLLAEQPDQVALLHRRASGWFEQRGSLAEAIRHALAGEDFERAAHLIELAFPAMSRMRQEATLLAWLKAIPEAILCERPVLCNIYAGVLLQTGEIEGVEDWLLAAERWLSATEEAGEQPESLPAGMAVSDLQEFRHLPATVALHRAGQAMLLGDLDCTMSHARRALDLALADDYLSRGGAGALLGLVFWTKGELETAHKTYAAGMANVQKAGYLADTVASAITLADMRMEQGRLREALDTYQRGLQLAIKPGAPALRGAADMHVGLSTLLYEQNDLENAVQHLHRAKALGDHLGLPQYPYRWRVAMARILEARGDLDGALELLDNAEDVFWSDFSPAVRPIPALRARVLVRQGRPGKALDWANRWGLSAGDPLSYLLEFQHITLARTLLALGRDDPAGHALLEATTLLERLLIAAEAGGRVGSTIELLVLQALAQSLAGRRPAALAALERAMTLAEPEGFVRIFVNEGKPLQSLLQEAAGRGTLPGYTQNLLSAFNAEGQGSLPAGAPPASSAAQPLIEPLSQRELEVLRLFRTELSGPEIADRLVIGLSTIRTHTKSIFGKLNVNNRRAAVLRAEELNLI